MSIIGPHPSNPDLRRIRLECMGSKHHVTCDVPREERYDSAKLYVKLGWFCRNGKDPVCPECAEDTDVSWRKV
jgi:hypothetical protein